MSGLSTLKQAIEELEEAIKQKRVKYHKYQIITEAVEECTKSEALLSEDLQLKVHKTMMVDKLAGVCTLADDSAMLGLDLATPTFTVLEEDDLKDAVEKTILEKYQTINKGLEETGIITTEGNLQENLLVDFKVQLREKQEMYAGLLEELKVSLLKIMDALATVPELLKQQLENYTLESELLEIKNKIVSAQLHLAMLNESPHTIEGYKKCLDEISMQQMQFKLSIEKLQSLKDKYKQASCKEYDEILSAYLLYNSKLQNHLAVLNNK